MALIACPECHREVSDKAPTCPNCGAPISPERLQQPQVYVPVAPEKKNISCTSAGCVILLVVFLIALIASQSGKSPASSDSTTAVAAASPPPSREEAALQNVELVDFSWSTGGFGSVMIATLVIRNKNDFPVKDVTVKCTHSGKSGTEIDSNTKTIYETIKPKKKRTFRDFNMGFIHSQAASSRCTVVGVVPAD